MAGNGRVDHWASGRDRSVGQLPQQPKVEPPVVPELDAFQQKIIEQEATIQRLVAKIESMTVPPPAFAGRRIAMAVAKAYGVTFNELISPRRQKHLVRARHHAMWEMRRNTSLAYPGIGKILGGRDHTTILHGIRRHERRLAGEIE